MKKTLSILGAVLSFVLTGFAQQPLQLTLASDAIAALGTNSPNVVISLDNTEDITLQVNLRLAAAVGVNSNITATLQTSADLVNWTSWKQFTLLTSGTTTVTLTTNYAVGSLPFMRVANFVSANTAAVAGLEVWKSTKRIR